MKTIWKWILGGTAAATVVGGIYAWNEHELHELGERTLYRQTERLVQSIHDPQLRAEANKLWSQYQAIEHAAAGGRDPDWVAKALPVIKSIRELKDRDR